MIQEKKTLGCDKNALEWQREFKATSLYTMIKLQISQFFFRPSCPTTLTVERGCVWPDRQARDRRAR